MHVDWSYTSYWILFSFESDTRFSYFKTIKSVSGVRLYALISISLQSFKSITDNLFVLFLPPFKISNSFFAEVT